MKALVACLSLGAVLITLDAQPSASIAHEYVAEAALALEAGNDGLASQLLRAALEYDAFSSDALALLGGQLVQEQATTGEGVELLNRAVTLDRFRSVPRNVAIVALATTLHETDRSLESLAFLEGLRVDPEDSRGLAADYAYALASTFAELGERAAADRQVALARDLFPNDPRFLRLALDLEPFPSIEHARELNRLADALRNGSDRYGGSPDRGALQEAFLLYAERATTEAERERAVREYIELGGERPRALALLVRFDLAMAVALFDQWEAWRSLELLRDPMFGELLAVDQVAATLAEASGEVAERGVDGRWRERLVVQSGRLVSWDVDEDGDGVSETSVRFSGESPTSLVVANDEGFMELEYGLYPFVESASVALHSGTETFVLRPRAVELHAVTSLPVRGAALSSLPTLTAVARPSVATLRQAAVRVDITDSSGTLVERRYHAAGDRVHLARDRNGDGQWDMVEVSSGGVPEQRAVDLDYDGYYEVLEGFRGGQRLVRAVDEDEDGVPELFQREIGVSVREWDINEDGRIDVREFEGWRASVVRDFPLLDQEL